MTMQGSYADGGADAMDGPTLAGLYGQMSSKSQQYLARLARGLVTSEGVATAAPEIILPKAPVLHLLAGGLAHRR